MKRKTSSLQTKIYTYGALSPTENSELVDKQFRLAHEYQNKLIEIERWRRAEFRGAVRKKSPDIVSLAAEAEKLTVEIDALYAIIANERMKNRSKRVDSPHRNTIETLKSKRTRVREQMSALTKNVLKEDVSVKAAVAAVDEAANDKIKEARSKNGLYWGTGCLVEKAMEAAKKSHMDPHFKHWRRPGRIGVQIQKRQGDANFNGMPVSDLFSGEDRRAHLEMVPEGAWNKDVEKSRNARHRLCRTRLHLRVASTEKGLPVWAVFPCILHRPLPSDGIVKWIWMHRVMLAHSWRYELQISVEAPSFTRANGKTSAIAVDLGWRRTTSSDVHRLRVAYTADDAKNFSDLRVPGEILRKLQHADSLRSIRDRNFDGAREKLIEARKSMRPNEWCKEKFAAVEKWRSSTRLAEAVWEWKDNRFEGDDQIYSVMDAWRKKERHLHEWEDNERDKAIARRNEFYKVTAAAICKGYGTVYIEKFNISQVARVPPVEQADGYQSEIARAYRSLTSPSEFRRFLVAGACAHGAKIIEILAAGTTIECYLCGHSVPWDTAPKVDHVCGGCGEKWDQDRNAALNILRRGLASSGDETPRAPAPLAPEKPVVSVASVTKKKNKATKRDLEVGPLE